MLLDLLLLSSGDVPIVGGVVHFGRLDLTTSIDEIGINDLHLPPLGEEGVVVLELLGSVVVADGLYLAQVQFHQPLPSKVLVQSTETLPFHEEGLKGGDGIVQSQ